MPERRYSENIKKKNIVDMALTFTAMMRLFAVGSKQKIAIKLEETFSALGDVNSHKQYELLHRSFCNWFVENITTAQKTLKNGTVKQSRSASYGHAAKVLDITTKVYVHYCCQPSPGASQKLVPLLNGGVDTPIMAHLYKTFPDTHEKVSTIQDVGYKEYLELQRMVLRDIQIEFSNKILPVEYDDIMWNRLNRNESE